MASTKKPAKVWPVHVSDETRYRVSLISTLYKMKVGDVLDRAVVCYANILRISDKMEQEFPKEGIPTPERTGKPRHRPNLSQFNQHKAFFEGRRKTYEGPEPEEESAKPTG